jgi:hypothetical protein
MQEIEPHFCKRLTDLFLKVGIKDSNEKIAQKLLYKLKMTEDINYASNYILQQLPSDIDNDERTAHFKLIKETLVDLISIIEFKNLEVNAENVSLGIGFT